MNKIFYTAAAAALACGALLGASQAEAHDFSAGAMKIDHPWARPNLPNRPVAVYMKLANTGDAADRLVAAEAPGFEAVELHTVVKDGDVMKMQPIEAVEVPAGGNAMLAPGGNHLMLFGASEQFAEGAHFPLTLVFENAGEVAVEVMIQKRPPEGMEGADGMMHHGGTHKMDHGSGAQSN